MAGQNDFQVFAGASNANVMTQAAYIALQARLTGFQTGIAQSIQLNKVWRQSSIISSMIAQFIADFSPAGVANDDGTIATLEANFVAAIQNVTRIQTTAPIFFVNPSTGSDLNSGLSPASALQTLAAVVTKIMNDYDLQGGTATVNMAAGTYTVGCTVIGNAQNGNIHFVGNTATPTTVSVNLSGAGVCFGSQYGARVIVSGCFLSSNHAAASASACLQATFGGTLNFDHITFGASVYHLYSGTSGSVVGQATTYTISGGASQSHISTQSAGLIDITSTAVTLTGTPAFSSFATAGSAGLCNFTGATFSGAATGLKFVLGVAGQIFTAGQSVSFLPGSVAGTGSGLATQGWYS